MSQNLFRDESYETPPFKIMKHYVDRQFQHLKRVYPDVQDSVLKQHIIKITKDRFRDPAIQRISFPEPGHSKKEVVSTTTHLKDITGNIVSPSGNTYCQPAFRESLVRLTIIENINKRNIFKKEMFKCEQAGDTHGQTIFNNLQTTKKISNNSTPGAMQSKFNILSDKSGFNAITSTTRLGVKIAYGTVERLLAGNIYLPTLEDALSYIYNTISVMPEECEQILNRYSNAIRYVEEEDFTNWVVSCMEWYSYREDFLPKLIKVIKTLTPLERTWVFYTGSWYNLFSYNTSYFKNFIDELFNRNIPVSDDIVAEDIFKVEDTLSNVVRGTNPDLYGKDENGDRYNLTDAIKYNPNGIRQIVAYARHIESYLNSYSDLLCLFLKSRNETPQPLFNHKLIRKATILCDTDSNLFTTNEIVRLYHGLKQGETDFSPRSFDVNALSVYILSRCLEHTFARYSSRSGIVGKDLSVISMKNEFLYTTFLRTNISKHYNGPIVIQEGNILRKSKLDIKGVNYIGSSRPKEITDGVKAFLGYIHNRVRETNGHISAEDILDHVASVERKIYQSLSEGEKSYLGGMNIKQPETYADGGERSCFYYRLWEEVFAKHFGIDVVLPNRFMKVPLQGEDKNWYNEKLMSEFKSNYPEVYKSLMEFRERNPSKKINYLVVPASVGSIPDMFRPWLDKRKVIKDMCTPYYLALRSLNLSVAIPERDVLVMDFLQGEFLKF